MPSLTSLPRSRPLRIAGLVAVALVLAGCAPDPEPAPTPTPAFASEEEAFAAAEATYRAYTDALNNVDPADPSTFEATYAFSSGDFQQADRKNFSRMHAQGQQILGDALVARFVGETASPLLDRIVAIVCIDVSGVEVIDSAGASVVNPNRPDVYEARVVFENSPHGFLIDKAGRIEGTTCSGL
ncbi:hypothetical protein AB0E56_09300 [Microbacterium sp. NPDC028030]|uniref:hypothetical protein n=1 Tax=Microbacterium sp. NPDC028030 TaxID=3155124 RepID=UPI0034070765